MKETKLKSFDFAVDLTKQLISLSTVLIAISITFFEKFSNNSNKWILIGSWIFLFLSIILGVFTLMTITGRLGQVKDEESINSLDIYGKNITKCASSQILSFIIGIFLLIIFSSFPKKDCEPKGVEGIKIIKETRYKIIDTQTNDTIIINNSH